MKDRQRKPWRIIKRLLDITLAFIFLILTSPILVLAAIAIKLTSKGPVLFKQTRIGKDRKPFVFYKLRSMYAGSSHEIHKNYIKELMTEKLTDNYKRDGVYKLVHDPRVTPVGKFIRKTSIDELPQLLNVLKGDMSIVGPRPAIPYELKYHDEKMLKRFSVKSGITGLWQVKARSTANYRHMVELDIFYINHWCIWLDIKILLKTILVIFNMHIAY